MRILLAGTLALGVVLIAAPAASAEKGERIASYDVSVTIAANGSAHVTEKIAYDFGTNERHGITRSTRRQTLAGPAKAISPDGAPTTVTMGDNYIKVGDSAVTLTGVHTYVLDYDVLDAVTLAGADAAVRWEVADASWNIPMSSVTGTITVPSAAKLSYCYVGPGNCGSGVATVDGAVTRVQMSVLSAKETLTVKATFSSAGMTLTPRATPTPTSYTPTYTTTQAAVSSHSSDRPSRGGVGIGWLFILFIGGGFVALVVAICKAGSSQRARQGGYYRRSHGSTGWYGGSSYDSYSSYNSSSSSSSYDSGSSSSSSSSYDSGSSSSSSSDSGSSGSW